MNENKEIEKQIELAEMLASTRRTREMERSIDGLISISRWVLKELGEIKEKLGMIDED